MGRTIDLERISAELARYVAAEARYQRALANVGNPRHIDRECVEARREGALKLAAAVAYESTRENGGENEQTMRQKLSHRVDSAFPGRAGRG